MNKEKSTQGFGLAVFSLILLLIAFVGVLSGRKISFIASLIGILSVVFAIAAFFEARRANGAKRFALISIIITILGTYLIFAWTGSLKQLPFSKNPPSQEKIIPVDTNSNDASKLIEKAEELEGDTIH